MGLEHMRNAEDLLGGKKRAVCWRRSGSEKCEWVIPAHGTGLSCDTTTNLHPIKLAAR